MGRSNYSYRYRIVQEPPLTNSYVNIENQAESGSTPLHHEIDNYLEEKGVEFDMGLIYRYHLLFRNEHKKYTDACVWLFDVSWNFLTKVIIPGLSDIGQKHGCYAPGMRQEHVDGKLCWVVEVKH